MNPQAAQQNYLRTRVLTATPEQLQMMLFDGAVRFAEQARIGLSQKNWEVSYNNISRCQKIIVELTSTLRHDVDPDLCGKLASLYTFAYKKLTVANIEHKMEALEEALEILKFQRETWALLLDKLGKEKAGKAAQNISFAAPDSRMEDKIRMSA
jgi:flagellar protein FliS